MKVVNIYSLIGGKIMCKYEKPYLEHVTDRGQSKDGSIIVVVPNITPTVTPTVVVAPQVIISHAE
jgi:hypothetical protein